MTDIAKRLRAWADPVEQGYEVPAAGQAMRDGADEIERLRTALELAAEWGVDSDVGGKNPVSAALRHWIKGGMYGPLTTEQKGEEG